ncbi:CLUMA_CG015659, isoform A [Clunio marinus]|uniref:CLUMA_CG015659, isoform A n=1 Tax=Clunio marinus TaxID=568069 RepID=A0A1J1IQB8_9DIPT|nr:CLUMA_CG015659, isoform A [Clunio marinus]
MLTSQIKQSVTVFSISCRIRMRSMRKNEMHHVPQNQHVSNAKSVLKMYFMLHNSEWNAYLTPFSLDFFFVLLEDIM